MKTVFFLILSLTPCILKTILKIEVDIKNDINESPIIFNQGICD